MTAGKSNGKGPEFFTKRGDFVGITHGFTEKSNKLANFVSALPLPDVRADRVSI